MKRNLLRYATIVALFLLCSGIYLIGPQDFKRGVSIIHAQAASHSAVLTWVVSTDDTTTACSATGATCAQNVYRAPSGCAVTNPAFVTLTSLAATATTYTDSSITPGTWCYSVTFALNGTESVKNTAQVILPPAAPTSLTITAN